MKRFFAIVKKLFCDEPTNPNNKTFIDDGNWKSIGTQPSIMEIGRIVDHDH
jgi:hypothetical protein